MGPSNWLRISLVGIAFAALLCAGSAGAQLLDNAERALGIGPDPIARSPRLAGMGRLSLVGDDRHNRITMWDFAGNPTGIAESETTSTLDLRPTTVAASDKHDVFASGLGRERQHLALREFRVGYEAWSRTGGTAYGAIGDLTRLRHDRPYDDDLELRSEHSQPTLMPVLTGQMPFFFSARARYALHAQYAYESQTDVYRKIIRNSVGDYIDGDGTQVDPPSYFEPDEFKRTVSGIGLATSYRIAEPLTASVGIDHSTNDLSSVNEGNRHRSEIAEDRPYTTGRGTLIGKLGTLEYGADARAWRTGRVEQRWSFTISSGVGIPLASRGKLLERSETGQSLRTRARWVVGNLELGAGVSTLYRKVKILGPTPNDSTSFNFFRNRLLDRVSADSLQLPDSVSSNEIEQRVSEFGAGVAWRFPGRRLLVGAEFHANRDLIEQQLAGRGPKRVGWEARAGAEWSPLDNLALRGGYLHRWVDRDDYTEGNEFVTNGTTLGVGLQPEGSPWTLDLGYLVEWSGADFGDPSLARGSRQSIAVQLGWDF